MAKLNKQEVSAVASKLHREFGKAAEEMRKQAILHYVPSETYSKVKELLEKRDSIEAEYNKMYRELEKTREEINKVCSFYVYNSDPKDKVLNQILSCECKLPSVPSVDELKDDITIAAIDSDFNTENYLKTQLEKYQ